MVSKLAAITILPMLLVGGVVANSSILVVTVHEAGGTDITVPVPLAVAQVALAFAPDEAKRVEIPEIAEYLPYLEQIVSELERVPDTVLVEVRDRGDHVTVAKEDDFLRVRVREDGDASVDVSIPLSTVRGIVAAYDAEDGVLHGTRVIGALRASPSGTLVHVRDDRDEVKVRMW